MTFEAELEFAPSVNYAMQQNDVPLVRRVVLRNGNPETLNLVSVRVWTEPAIIEPVERRLESMPPGSEFELKDLRPLLLRGPLVALTEREIGHIRLTVSSGERLLVERRDQIEILAFNEWTAVAAMPELTGAFVLPNDPAVEVILGRARELMIRAGDPDGALSGYQSKDPRRAWKMAAAIYEAIASFDIGYINPPASFERTGQKVRTPSQILEHRLATCLDLSFIYAASCEQAGLNPLITLLKEHAFAGVWLIPERLPVAAVGHAAELRKRIDLNEMVAVELTGLCKKPPLSFPQALLTARRRLNEDAAFEKALDVGMARAAGVRPIPVRKPDEAALDAAPSATVARPSDPTEHLIAPPDDWKAPESGGAEQRSAAAPPETPAQRLERWKQKLLDLTLRNRLLNFKDTKKSIPILCPNVARLEDLLSGGREFRLFARPEVMGGNDPRDPSLHQERTGKDALDEFLKEAMEQKKLHAGLPDKELEGRLIEIDRTSRLALEEGGANTLYLAIGFLRWYEADASDRELRAPILLVPMRMERATVREGFRLKRLDDESRINVTLLKRLEQMGMVIDGLDPLPEDESGLDVPKILDRVRSAVKAQPRWDVFEEASLCILTFTKFLMWVDLQKNADALKRNDVVRHLIETPNEPFGQEGFPEETSLDDTYSPAKAFCPVDADSSQLAAVFASAEGRSFVLQGPPGTGKSQTITNLVAQELALGRRVLFVSEKMAALNVVHSRLAKVGLGPFCLELHSTKVTREAVRRQLKEAMDAAAPGEIADWDSETRRLEALRRELNAYVRALHAETPCGLSAFRALSTLIGRERVAEVGLPFGPADSVDREALAAMRTTVMALRQIAAETGSPVGHPLRAARTPEWHFALPEQVRVAAASARGQVIELGKAARVPLVELGFGPAGHSRRELAFAAAFLEALETSPSPPANLLTEADWSGLKARLQGWLAKGHARDSARASLLLTWKTSFLSANHDEPLQLLAQAKVGGFLKRWLLVRRVKKLLAPHRVDEKVPDLLKAEADLNTAAALKTESALLSDSTSEAARCFGRHWKNGEADWKALGEMLEWAGRYRDTLATLQIRDPAQSAARRPRLTTLASEHAGQFKPGGTSFQAAQEFSAALRRNDESLSHYGRILDIDPLVAWGGDDAPGFVAAVVEHVDSLAKALPGLQDWCSYQAARNRVTKLGLQPLASALHDGTLNVTELEAVFEKSFARWLFDSIAASESVIRTFHGAHHATKIEDFRKLDVQVRDLSRQIVLSRIHSNLPRNQANGERARSSETGKLQRFVMGGRISIRRLFLECPNVLALYKPCVLMSPLSVAQFLGADFPPFDLVVFDEASQMPAWEAVGAIARGTRLVVVGDSKQLPPTSFFDRRTDEDIDLDEGDVGDEESILDECVGAQVAPLTLKWHYRSRHESLIAFSNRQYYDGKLLTFPGAVAKTPTLGVSWVEVPGGMYEGGATRTNRKEAETVVGDIVRRLKDPQESLRSVGVVTFSIAQQRLIEDLLEKARERNPEIEPFFTRETEPLFIKNLETVQGDERDVILFSICYGPDEHGKVALRFGPLNAKGGERRLNVAITRAREQVVVFSTLRPDQIDLSRTEAIGVKDLKLFLEYARRGPDALNQLAGASPSASCESPFEQAVFDALSARGWTLHKQVGCSGYRIDLAVVDPKEPGRYVLGIECDGANYHSSRTARDRDRLRASVLAGLGWKLHRIWSTDWMLDARRQLDKAEAAIRDAIRSTAAPEFTEAAAVGPTPGLPISGVTGANGPIPTSPLLDSSRPIPTAETTRATAYAKPLQDVVEPPGTATASLPGRRPYATVDLPQRAWNGPGAFHDQAATSVVRQVIHEIVKVEGPILFELLARRVGACWGLQRATDRVKDRIRPLISRDDVFFRFSGKRRFLWPVGADPANWSTFRVNDGPESGRLAEEICPEEIACAAGQLLEAHVSLQLEDLLRETARQFGIQRLGANVRAYFEEGVDLLCTSGRATRNADIVRLARSPVGQ